MGQPLLRSVQLIFLGWLYCTLFIVLVFVPINPDQTYILLELFIFQIETNARSVSLKRDSSERLTIPRLYRL